MTQDDGLEQGRFEEGRVADVDALARQVMSVLCDRQAHAVTGVREFIKDYIVRAVIQRASFDAECVLEELRGHRLAIDSIIDDYIPDCARELGDMWLNSDLDFATVTVGTLRLQSLLSQAAAELPALHMRRPGDLLALIVIPDDEQHFLGASIVAAQLRRLGVATEMSFHETPSQLIERLSADGHSMVLFTCARVEGLAVVRETVQCIRQGLDPAPVLALGGAALSGDRDRIKKETNADLVTLSAKEVVGFCTKRHKALDRE